MTPSLKRPYFVKDKAMGMEYLVRGSDETHYDAMDSFGYVVRIHKTQAYRVKASEVTKFNIPRMTRIRATREAK